MGNIVMVITVYLCFDFEFEIIDLAGEEEGREVAYRPLPSRWKIQRNDKLQRKRHAQHISNQVKNCSEHTKP